MHKLIDSMKINSVTIYLDNTNKIKHYVLKLENGTEIFHPSTMKESLNFLEKKEIPFEDINYDFAGLYQNEKGIFLK